MITLTLSDVESIIFFFCTDSDVTVMNIGLSTQNWSRTQWIKKGKIVQSILIKATFSLK